MKNSICALLAAVPLFVGAGDVSQPLKLAALFGDHAVLQREKPVPVWGTGGVVGEKLALTVGAATTWAKVAADGIYRFVLPPQKAGGPYELTVTAADGRKAVSKDVMFGEVWVCSGQSNMAFTMRNAKPGWGDADEPLVRGFSQTWTTGTAKGAAGFSAVGGFFARELCHRLGVAVGILIRADGGTRIESWTSREGLVRTASGSRYVARHEALQSDPRAWKEYARWTDEMKLDPGPSSEALAWAKPDFVDADWKATTLPSWFDELELLRRHGAVWYRKTVELPKDWKGRDLKLRIPGCDKHDLTFVNGVKVGGLGKGLETEYYALVRNYTVPAAAVADGKATVAIRIWSWAGAGGIGDADGDFSLTCPGLPGFVDLYAGEWKWKDELGRGPARGGFAGILNDCPDYPGMLFESRIRPLVGSAIRGVVWYQGEDNGHNCNDYYELLGGLVDDWRHQWGQGDFPFAAVQLAGFGDKAGFQRTSTWPVIREAILRLSRDKRNFGVASAMDVGCETDIHPVNKRTVGERLAGWALHDVYGVADAVPTGPRIRKAVRAGAAVDLVFDDVADGLKGENGDAPKGFWLAGADGEFRPAEAKITGLATVRVFSKDVKTPTEVRYAWAKNPEFAELRNSADLPASSFRIPVAQSASAGSDAVEELSETEKRSVYPGQLWVRAKPFALPDMFLSESGRRITTREEWERIRRPEIRRWFETHMHGVRPVERPDGLTFTPLGPDREILGGRAVQRRVRIGYRGALGEGGFDVAAFIPAAGRPAPAFVLIVNQNLSQAFERSLTEKTGFFPVEDIVRRGYAAVTFLHTDVAHDGRTHSLTGGVFAAFGPETRTRTSWGSISAWAWGASRVLDWIETEPALDAKHVAVIGHSRCGKTALYAAAVDERFAMACVNDSGCCGAKLNHAQVPMSENIELDNVVNPHWFCSAYRDWDGRDHEVPYDQHELAALVAPRLLAIGSASCDIPAGPYGEYLTAQLCSPAWELYGKRGLVADPEVEARRGFRGFPACGTAIDAGCVSYHLRRGEHQLDYFDWKCYMDFADRHGWR